MASSPQANNQPIIIIKKKGGHGGHHGGAWKVAYADFVTAMMALFIVLWLLNTSKQVQEAVGGYFRDPKGHGKMVGTNLAGIGDSLQLKKEEFSKIKDKLEIALKKSPEFKKLKDQIEITVTGEGLRIELLESEKGHFFNQGSSQPTETGSDVIGLLAAELGRLNNKILIEGHTDSRPYSSDREYSNWELSTDRANMSRRLMQEHGVKPDQIKQVRGFADQHLRNPQDPLDPSNRRVSILIQYEDAKTKSADEVEKLGKGPGGKPAEGHGEASHAEAAPKAEGHGDAPPAHGAEPHKKAEH